MNHKEKGTTLDNFRILSRQSFEISLKRLHSDLRQTPSKAMKLASTFPKHHLSTIQKKCLNVVY